MAKPHVWVVRSRDGGMLDVEVGLMVSADVGLGHFPSEVVGAARGVLHRQRPGSLRQTGSPPWNAMAGRLGGHRREPARSGRKHVARLVLPAERECGPAAWRGGAARLGRQRGGPGADRPPAA